jgi:hypothetical protein
VRKAGLNIMMSMKGDGKPVSFIEDCAVPLEHLAEYTERLTQVFDKHGTRGTWYAHASVGTLHVRPVLDMRRDGAQKMRAIAEEAARWCGNTKARTPASTATGWCAPSGSSRSRLPKLTARWRDQGAVRSERADEPGQDRAIRRSMDDRTLFRFKPGRRAAARHRARLVGMGRLRPCRRDVQQQRPLPQVRRGTMCPSYPRHARRAA